MKRKMTVIIISIAALLLIVWTTGLSLPKESVFVKEAILESPVAKVFRVVTDVQAQTKWRSDVKEIKRIDSQTWTEVPKKGTPITFRTRQKVENELFEIEIIEPTSFNGYWVGTFESLDGNKTKVIFKEVIQIENPLLRLAGYFFVDLDETMEDYMNNLKTLLGN